MKNFLFILFLVSSVSFASVYKVDLSHSKIAFKIKHLSISNVYGSFDKFKANISYDEKSKKLTKLESQVNVKSINTDNKKRDNHLKSGDFFNVKKFQKIGFEMLSATDDKIIANLTIKNITKKVSFDYEFGGLVKGPRGKTRLGFSLEANINRKDFDIKWNKTLDTGSLVLGEKVKIIVDIESIKQKK